MDEEIGDIEDDEGGIGDDVEVDGDGAGEVAGGYYYVNQPRTRVARINYFYGGFIKKKFTI